MISFPLVKRLFLERRLLHFGGKGDDKDDDIVFFVDDMKAQVAVRNIKELGNC